MDEKLVEDMTRRARTVAESIRRPGGKDSKAGKMLYEMATALTLAQARIRELEEAIWLAHDQLNTYRSAAVEEVIDKLETYIPGLSGKEAPNV
jgi:hypothetical protein